MVGSSDAAATRTCECTRRYNNESVRVPRPRARQSAARAHATRGRVDALHFTTRTACLVHVAQGQAAPARRAPARTHSPLGCPPGAGRRLVRPRRRAQASLRSLRAQGAAQARARGQGTEGAPPAARMPAASLLRSARSTRRGRDAAATTAEKTATTRPCAPSGGERRRRRRRRRLRLLGEPSRRRRRARRHRRPLPPRARLYWTTSRRSGGCRPVWRRS